MSGDGTHLRLTRPRLEGEVEIVVCVADAEFQVLSKIALDTPGETVGDVAARLLCERLDEISDDL